MSCNVQSQIRTELAGSSGNRGTAWYTGMDNYKDFIDLDDNFPKEGEVDDYGDHLESDIQAEYVRTKTSYLDLRREPFMARETLEAAAETPVERTTAQLAKPIKHQSERLMENIRQRQTCVKTAFAASLVQERLEGAQSLKGQREKLVGD